MLTHYVPRGATVKSQGQQSQDQPGSAATPSATHRQEPIGRLDRSQPGEYLARTLAPPNTALSLTHLIREPATKSAHPPLLLLLHGVGGHESDLLQLAPHLDDRFFVVGARAPITLAPGSYAWFHVAFTPSGPLINPDHAEQSRSRLLRFIDEGAAAYRLDRRRVYLMGFSQGAVIGHSIALTCPQKLAGLVAMSGRVLPEVLPGQAPSEAFRGLAVMVVHGLDDQKLAISYGRKARDLWSRLPAALTYREYAMGHEVTQESLTDIGSWLKERLDGESPSPPLDRGEERRSSSGQEEAKGEVVRQRRRKGRSR